MLKSICASAVSFVGCLIAATSLPCLAAGDPFTGNTLDVSFDFVSTHCNSAGCEPDSRTKSRAVYYFAKDGSVYDFLTANGGLVNNLGETSSSTGGDMIVRNAWKISGNSATMDIHFAFGDRYSDLRHVYTIRDNKCYVSISMSASDATVKVKPGSKLTCKLIAGRAGR